MRSNRTLPPRLAAIAGLVPRGKALADVGTDHALLPLWLLERGIIPAAVATDIHEGPLERTRHSLGNVKGLRLVLCDGLEGVEPQEVQTVVIAGLGGENIADILRRAPWCLQSCTLLLQPMSKAEVLRKALAELGCRIENEILVEDNKHIYPILTARGGERLLCSEAEYYTGSLAYLEGDPLFPAHLDRQVRRLRATVDGLDSAGREGESPLLRQALIEMEDMRRKIHAQCT